MMVTKSPRDGNVHLAVYTIATLVSPAYLSIFNLDMQSISLKFLFYWFGVLLSIISHHFTAQ